MMTTSPTATLPDARGRFGDFGGQFVPETLMAALAELETAYNQAKTDPAFQRELAGLLTHYAGRPTPLYFAANLTRRSGGAKIYLKREDLAHTGAHKINNALGQALLAKYMGKARIIAETGAGQHGVATATVCAMLGLQCLVYMGAADIRRQAPNVFRMRLLAAEVIPVEAGSRTLKDAINEAIRDWVTNVETTHYLIGSAVGPHPYPMLVRDFQAIIGREARAQILEAEGRLPDYVVACVGGGSNAIGAFYDFIGDESVRLLGIEAGGDGVDSGRHSATLTAGRPGVLHGSMSYLLQDRHGQVRETHSLSAGLDYPGVGPGTQLPERYCPGRISGRHGRPGARGLSSAFPSRGHYPGLGAVPCHPPRRATGGDSFSGANHPGLPQRTGGQGCANSSRRRGH